MVELQRWSSYGGVSRCFNLKIEMLAAIKFGGFENITIWRILPNINLRQ